MAKNPKKAPSAKYAVIPNQVFLGIPWKTVRPKYESIVDKLKKTFAISFAIVGRQDNQDAEDLLEVIKKRLLTSSYAIFPRGTGQIRPVGVTSRPASCESRTTVM